ncbi:hypothetical protein JCM10908_002558 [Rhodotorula pacifica]|uniref:rRNA-processing protein RRP36 n=1 Tax=Rhodotorula pacifica TaxID=1495444 RepID=UPI00316EF1BF
MPAARTATTKVRRAPSPVADFDEDEQLFEQDSEEDEWATDRQAGPSRAAQSAYQQDSEDDDEDDAGARMYDDDDEEEDGVAAFESDPGEELVDSEEDADPEAKLASIPFTSLLKAQKQLNKGKQKAVAKGKGAQDGGEEDARDAGGKRLAKNAKGKGKGDRGGRTNKHAPTEMSARRPVSRVRQVVETQELKARDPRFDVLSGSVNKDLFRKSYSFLADQHQQELETMRKTAAAARKNRQLPQEEKDRIDEALRRMENREVTRKNRDLQEEAMRQWKKEEADKRKEGKKAFFLKESEKKKLFLKAKYDDLAQDKRKLHKAMDKKRRKTSQKEKKLMPKSRPGPY